MAQAPGESTAGQCVGVDRSIQFHEPHPEKKIPYWWARRLTRAFGWTGGDICAEGMIAYGVCSELGYLSTIVVGV
jgi:hypothetical protein